MIKTRLLVPLLTAGLLVPSIAQAGFLKGPYLQRPTQTSIVISWQSEGSSEGTVAWGPTSALGSSVNTAGASAFQEVELTGLLPATTYHYEVTADGQTSTTATFRTGPLTDQPFNFVVIGDTRTDGEEHQAVVDRVIATVGAPDLVLNTGDLVDDGGNAEEWATFFDIEHALMASSPLFPVAGNHDDLEQDSIYQQLFNLPPSTAPTENWHAHVYGNTLFVGLDTNEPYHEASDQYVWLEAELAAANADPAVRHIVASFHDPAFSSGGHGVIDPEDWEPVRDHLVPLFETYGVDVAFSGHDHHYERADPALTGNTLYIVSGGGGAPGNIEDFVEGVGDFVGDLMGMPSDMTVGEYLDDHPVLAWTAALAGYGTEYVEDGGGWWRVYAEVVKHFVFVEVAGDWMGATVYDVNGTVIDTWEIGTYDGNAVDDDGDGFTELQNDCDDSDASIHPGAVDECDGVDNDCNGVDDGCGDDDDAQPDDDDAQPDDDDVQPDDDDAQPDDDDTGSATDDDDAGIIVEDPVEQAGCDCGSSLAAGAGTWLSSLLLLLALRRKRH